MTTKEEDFNKGQLQDLQAEKLQFQADFTLEEKIEGIGLVVDDILRRTLHAAQMTGDETIIHDCQAIVCSDKHTEAAQAVGRHYKLTVITSPFMPENEIFISRRDQAETLIKSRFEKQKKDC